MNRPDLEASVGTNYERHGEYGLSVFAHSTWSAVEIWRRTAILKRYKRIRVSTVGTLGTVGFLLKPTWEAPH
jgi:hypothetical protein